MPDFSLRANGLALRISFAIVQRVKSDAQVRVIVRDVWCVRPGMRGAWQQGLGCVVSGNRVFSKAPRVGGRRNDDATQSYVHPTAQRRYRPASLQFCTCHNARLRVLFARGGWSDSMMRASHARASSSSPPRHMHPNQPVPHQHAH